MLGQYLLKLFLFFYLYFRLTLDLFGTEIFWRTLLSLRLDIASIQFKSSFGQYFLGVLFLFGKARNANFCFKEESIFKMLKERLSSHFFSYNHLKFLFPNLHLSFWLQLDGFIIPLLQGNILKFDTRIAFQLTSFSCSFVMCVCVCTHKCHVHMRESTQVNLLLYSIQRTRQCFRLTVD